MSTCIFAGTFDPITKGHVSLIKKVLKDHKNVLVVIGDNKDKSPFFSNATRIKMVKEVFSKFKGVTVVDYLSIKDKYVDYLSSKNAKFYARGIRNTVDLEYEKKYEEINKKLYPEITTIYYKAKKGQEKLSSTFVRERILEGKDFKRFVPKKAYYIIKDALKKDEQKN